MASFETNADEVRVGAQTQSSGITANDFTDTVTYTLVSHEGVNTFRVKVYDFDLPTVWLATADGTDISSKTTWKEGANIAIYDGTKMDLRGTTQVKGRGNMTWGGPKKPYTVKLDSKSKVLGMPKDKRWNFLANYYDKSDIRNDLALEFAHRSPGIAWSSHGKFVELILNGVHKGNYYLCEHNKISSDRVNIYEQDEDTEVKKPVGFDYSGGYLLEFDSYFDETNKFHSSITTDYKKEGLPINLKSPDWEGYDMTYIQDWILTLEAKLTDADIASTDYMDYLDIDSYIDYWFVYELMRNGELSHPKSSYMYKDSDITPKVDSKIHAGPVWDFDLALLSASYTGWIAKSHIWYGYLFNDPAFVLRTKVKWNAQKADYQDLADNYIDALAAKVKVSVERDIDMWGNAYDGSLTFDEIVAKFKTYLSNRINWMDTEINSW